MNLDHKLVTTDLWFIFSGEIFFPPLTQCQGGDIQVPCNPSVWRDLLSYLFTEGLGFWCPSPIVWGGGRVCVSLTRLSTLSILPFLGSL